MSRKKVNYPLFVADFETTSQAQYLIENKTRVYLWEFKDKDNGIVKKGVDIDSFMYEISRTNIDCGKPYNQKIVYFHNLSFDGEFLLWWLMENGYQEVEELNYDWDKNNDCFRYMKPKTMQTIITDTNAIFMIKVVFDNMSIVEFRCSYKVFPNSIEAIGEMVGVPKLNETHNYEELKNYNTINDVTEEEWLYLENDVEILRLLICYLNSIGMLSISMSTNSYKYWKKDNYMFCKCNMIKPSDERINTAIEKSYRGGITMINKEYSGVLVDKAVSFDVNSLYPSVMYNNSMPIGEGKYYEKLEDCRFPKRLIGIYVLMAEVIEGLHPFIGTSSGFSFDLSYNYDRVIQDKTLYLWEEEYELFELCYRGEWTITCCVGFKEARDVFKDYIDHWGEVKMKAPKDSAERQFAKLCLNSLCGKFGMNSLRYSKKPIGIEQDKLEYRIDETQTFYYYKPIASYITSMARCVLVRAIILCADRFIYCDTDSIYLKGWELPKELPVDDKKLGYWKFEHYYNHFKGLKAKCYLKDWTEKGKIKYDSSIAGLPKDARKMITYDNFQDGLEIKDCKKCKMKVKGGIIIGKTSFKIKVKV